MNCDQWPRYEYPPTGVRAVESSVNLLIELSHLGIPYYSTAWVARTIVRAQTHIFDRYTPGVPGELVERLNKAWEESVDLQLGCHGLHISSKDLTSTKVRLFERLIKEFDGIEKAAKSDFHMAVKDACTKLRLEASRYLDYLKIYCEEEEANSGGLGIWTVTSLWQSEPNQHSWAFLKLSIAKVVKAMDLLEACYSAKDSSASLDRVPGANPYWSVAMLSALYFNCHPFMAFEMQKQLEECPVFPGDNLIKVRSLAVFDMYQQIKQTMSLYGIKRPLDHPRTHVERVGYRVAARALWST